MTTRKYSSRSQQTTLSGALTSSGTSATVVSATSLLGGTTLAANETFTIVIDPDTALEEIVDIKSTSGNPVSGNTLTIERGRDGSSGVAHSAGAVVRHMAIGRDYREANTHIENTTTAHGLTLANVVKTTDTNVISSGMIITGAVGTTKIDDLSITEGKIVSSAVTAADVDAVTVDGTAFLTTSDLEDGVHPSSLGHSKWAVAIEAAITQTPDPAKFTAGPFSTSNTFTSSAAVTIADLGANKSMICTWYQNGSSTGTRVLCGYFTGNFGSGAGWGLVLDTSSNTLLLIQRPSAFYQIAASLSTGWHSIAITYTAAGAIQFSLDGATPVAASMGADYYEALSTAKFTIGYDSNAGTQGAAYEKLAAVAVFDYRLTAAELQAASAFGKARGQAPLALTTKSGCRVAWTAENYDAAEATQASLGAVPVTLTRNGTITRTAV